MTYAPHPTAPPMMAHQTAEFLASRDTALRALFWEMRTGKSRVVIDTTAYLYDQKSINALLVVAMPAGVTGNWAYDEIPAWLPPRIPRHIVRWQSAKAATLQFQEHAKQALTTDGLACLLVNGEALIRENFLSYLRAFMAKRRVLVCFDETSLIAGEPGAARTKKAHALARHPNAVYRRILDGTPSAESPLKLYSQWKLLDIAILGQPTYAAFKAHYAEFVIGADRAHREAVDRLRHTLMAQGVDRELASARAELQMRRVGKTWPELKGYKNIDELRERQAPHSSRILFRDVFDAPPKRYQFARYEMSAEQARVYGELKEQYQTELRGGGQIVAAMALTRYLRLQQILANFIPTDRVAVPCPQCQGGGCDACGDYGMVVAPSQLHTVDPKHHPRMDILMDILRQGAPAVVWCRFTREIEEVLARAKAAGIAAARYDGHTTLAAKQENKSAFQKGTVDLLVAQIQSAGRGIPLFRAAMLIYYSNTFSLTDRLQSEERGEAGHKRTSTMIIDIRAEGTIDDTITDAYRAKRAISDHVMGELSGQWL